MKSAAAIAFELRPSRLLAGALAGIALLAVLAIALSGLRRWPWIAAAVGIAVALVLLRTLRRLRRPRWRRAGWNADGVWTLLDGAQIAVGAHLLGWRAFGLSLLLRLHTAAGEAVTLCLLPDNLDRDTRRRLRVRLDQEAARPPPPTTC
ncbi:protein YgfX [Tahibacter caeni]|uniref:protein YgfX n=1 Tax=Tahibacter caeni TaxID=1453545 RepID=UPI0021490E8D|nr:protein YgfX [Tahibacter caeni]